MVRLLRRGTDYAAPPDQAVLELRAVALRSNAGVRFARSGAASLPLTRCNVCATRSHGSVVEVPALSYRAGMSTHLGPNPAVNSDAPVHIFCFAHAAGGAPVTWFR